MGVRLSVHSRRTVPKNNSSDDIASSGGGEVFGIQNPSGNNSKGKKNSNQHLKNSFISTTSISTIDSKVDIIPSPSPAAVKPIVTETADNKSNNLSHQKHNRKEKHKLTSRVAPLKAKPSPLAKETESERLYREEQEHQEKKECKKQIGCEGSEITTNSVGSDRSVLRLVNSLDDPAVESIPSKPSTKLKSVTIDPLTQFQRRQENTFLQYEKPLGGIHKHFSGVLANEMSSFSHNSAQYIRSLNRSDKPGVLIGNKVSPLVSLGDKAVIRPKTRDKTSTWRLVPLESIDSEENMKYRLFTHRDSNHRVKRDDLLCDSNLTMNKIEKFLETREHIDKAEFDVVVRNLVNGKSPRNEPFPLSRNTIPLSKQVAYIPGNRPNNSSFENSVKASLVRHRSGLIEPAINSTHLPTVSMADSGILRNQLNESRYSNVQSFRGQDISGGNCSTHQKYEINADILIPTFQGESVTTHDGYCIRGKSNLNSCLKELPPLNTLPLVTKHTKTAKRLTGNEDDEVNKMLQEIEDNMADAHCVHNKQTGSCLNCKASRKRIS